MAGISPLLLLLTLLVLTLTVSLGSSSSLLNKLGSQHVQECDCPKCPQVEFDLKNECPKCPSKEELCDRPKTDQKGVQEPIRSGYNMPNEDVEELCKLIEESKSDVPPLLLTQLQRVCSRSETDNSASEMTDNHVSKLTETNHHVSKLTATNQAANPAFTAELSSDRSLSHEVPVTFDNVLMDPNDSFTPLLGTFQCPDDGVYAFYWTISAPEGRVAAELVKQGISVKYGPLTSEITGSFSGSSSMSSILECTEGDVVWLKAVAWPDEDACNKIEGVYSSLTGFRLFGPDDEDAIAFTAELSSDTSTDEPVYDDVIVNIGSDYEADTGEFTCSSEGVYVFTVSSHIGSGGANTYLRKNGGVVCYPANPSNTQSTSADSGTSTGTCVIECDEGDVITVTTTSNREHLARVSSFTGYRLPDSEDGMVAFYARLEEGNEDYRDGQTLMFENAITNVGGRYFPTAGFFICPDSELYVLIWSVRTFPEYNGRACEARLVTAKDGDVEVVKAGPRTSQMLTGTVSSSSSTQVVAQCELERAFYVQAVVSDNELMAYYYRHTTFGGFRLPAS